MKTLMLRLSLLLVCVVPFNAMAIPILSSDGSLLSGVEVGGQLYDVTFGDAVLGDIYPLSLVGEPGWSDLANAMKQGIVNALNALPTLPLPDAINGCDGRMTNVAGCLMLIPDAVINTTLGLRLSDTSAAALRPTGAERFPASSALPAAESFDTAVDFAPGLLTVAQFRPANVTVPEPGSLSLLLMALVGVRSLRWSVSAATR